MKQKHYYMIVNKRGNIVVNGAQLPIYWHKKVAERYWSLLPEGFEIVRVTVTKQK